MHACPYRQALGLKKPTLVVSWAALLSLNEQVPTQLQHLPKTIAKPPPVLVKTTRPTAGSLSVSGITFTRYYRM
jgi:hypothetical protein